MSEVLSRDDFAEHKGTKFKAQGNAEFELVDVSELNETEHTETFSLVFEAPADAEIVNGTVSVEHEKLGSIDLGVSPFDQDENTTKYEAVFNRLKPSAEQSE